MEGRGDEADGLDRLGGETEPVDRLGLGMQEGNAGRGRERVARDQAREDERCAGERERARRRPHERDSEDGEEDGPGDEATARAGSLCEVGGRERAVDAGANGAGEDDDVALESGCRAHRTITSPSMSRLCSVHTYR